ncbi:hypothetical protein [Bradyrhizobium sp.]|uniref:hypothetical protein n=1 Tax=Bradyrhizobium sp. TaxID=376 RepID=UPI001EC28B17|nr:hypothetical protein [Bradyrhizobium sp.]MBV8919534.1 hypothetical protein [Bradyrhizobium sp.]MBV9985990.1 hypothetical protein [Bradyrhizobium sp.]
MANGPGPQHAPALSQGSGRATAAPMIARGALGLAIRGLLGVLLGIILISAPAEELLPFAMLASALMLLEGAFVVALMVLRLLHSKERRAVLSWRDPVVLEVGAVILLVPAFPVVPIVAAWTLVAALLVLMVILATAQGSGLAAELRWLVLAIFAVVCYGALLIRAMTIEPVAFTASLGVLTILFGIALLVLAVRLRPRRNAAAGTTMLAGPMR